jgi:hypothetical protein
VSSGEYQVFRCPNCQQFISTKVDKCRFCSINVTDEIKLKGIEEQENEDKAHRVKDHKNWLYSGIGVFALGLFLFGYSLFTIYFTNHGRFFIWSPILVLVGLGQILYSIFDIYNEKK